MEYKTRVLTAASRDEMREAMEKMQPGEALVIPQLHTPAIPSRKTLSVWAAKLDVMGVTLDVLTLGNQSPHGAPGDFFIWCRCRTGDDGQTSAVVPVPEEAGAGKRGRPKSELVAILEGMDLYETRRITLPATGAAGYVANARSYASMQGKATGRRFVTTIETGELVIFCTLRD